MKTLWKIGALLILWLVITMVFTGKTSAGGNIPSGKMVFEVNGITYLYVDGDNDDILIQVCPCENECEIESQMLIPEEYDPTPQVFTETPDPTFVPGPTSTSVPETKKTKCNAGVENGSEYYWDGSKWVECDPGNSGQHGGKHD